MSTLVLTSQVAIEGRHRQDLGDLQGLADSIDQIGLLHPIVVDADLRLIAGQRRLVACRDNLGWSEIPVTVLDVPSLLQAEHDENECRKDFTVSERVAIAREIEAEIGNRRGERTDKAADELPQNFAEVEPGQETRDVAAKKAGFGNRETYRQAAKVVDNGVPELVEAMDDGSVAPSVAAAVATLPHKEQKQVAGQGPEAMKAKAKGLRQPKAATDADGFEADPDPRPEDQSQEEPEPTPKPKAAPRPKTETNEDAVEWWIGFLNETSHVLANCMRRRGGIVALARKRNWPPKLIETSIARFETIGTISAQCVRELREAFTCQDQTQK